MIRITGAYGIKYIIDGERYWPEETLKEAIGCKDDDIFGEIKKLREGNNTLMELHANHISMLKDYADLAFELSIGSGDAESIKDYITSLKEERDELKEKCDKLKKRANVAYGASCGYSASKEPAFLCDVISYTWNLAPIAAHSLMDEPSYRIPNDSIRVELELTPTANYKGTIDPEDLKQYIQAYGREKKLGIVESVDYQNAKAARAELAHLYKKVLGKDRLDRDLSPHEVMKAILDEYKRIRPVLDEYRTIANNNFNKAEEFRKEKRAVEDSLAELRAKVCEIYRSVVDDEWDEHLSYTSALNDINEEYKRVVHNFEERTADWSKAQDELDRLEKFRRDVAKRIGRDPDAIKTPEVIMHALDIELERGENMDKLRDKLMDILGYEVKPGGVDKNNQAILEQVKKLKESDGHDKLFRDSVCDALDATTAVSDSYLFKKIEKLKLDHKETQERYSRYCLAVGSLCNIPAEHREDISWIEDSFNHTKKDYLKLKDDADKLARFRSNVCTALCLGGETSDEDILEEVSEVRTERDKLIVFRNDVTKAECNTNYFREFEKACSERQAFIFKLCEALGLDKEHVGSFFDDEETDILNATASIVRDCSKAKLMRIDSDRRRKMWQSRYESEHERANCVQKALDREREKCRVKDISLETTKKQYEKVCSNLETAECALNGMKSKVRKLQEELNAERHPNLTEDIETHPIDTDPGYLRRGEEDGEE